MKIAGFLLLAICISISANAQYDTTPPYLKNKSLPDFSLLTVDSAEFTKQTLLPDKPTVIMLFNPECEHCQQQLDVFLSIRKFTSSCQLILSSIETPEKNKAFFNKNQLAKYPFIHFGKDYKYFFGAFFQPRTIPVLIFYNKNREFVSIHHGNIKKKVILEALQQME